jgi:Domain of Unknown Function (DUF928)
MAVRRQIRSTSRSHSPIGCFATIFEREIENDGWTKKAFGIEEVNYVNVQRITSLVLSLLLLFPGEMRAQNAGLDDPPPNTGGRSGGSRGYSGGSMAPTDSHMPALMLLAPLQSQDRTVATRPIFAGFVRDSGSVPMEFRLYQYDAASQDAQLATEIQDEDFTSSPGIVTFSLPHSVAPLMVGEKYLWQVEWVCDARRPSGNPYAEAKIEGVEMPADLAEQLDGANTAADRAVVYARQNFWYDALAVALTEQPDRQLARLRVALFENIAADSQERDRLQDSKIHLIQS